MGATVVDEKGANGRVEIPLLEGGRPYRVGLLLPIRSVMWAM